MIPLHEVLKGKQFDNIFLRLILYTKDVWHVSFSSFLSCLYKFNTWFVRTNKKYISHTHRDVKIAPPVEIETRNPGNESKILLSINLS